MASRGLPVMDAPLWEAALKLGMLKVHRVADFTFTAINTWEAIPFDLKIDSESTTKFKYLNEGEVGEDKSIIVSQAEGTFVMGGCLRPKWTGGVAGTAILGGRVQYLRPGEVVWGEARCLQSVTERVRQTNEIGTQHYLGTLTVTRGTWLRLQGYVTNTDLILSGWAEFDNPVSASFFVYGVS